MEYGYVICSFSIFLIQLESILYSPTRFSNSIKLSIDDYNRKHRKAVIFQSSSCSLNKKIRHCLDNDALRLQIFLQIEWSLSEVKDKYNGVPRHSRQGGVVRIKSKFSQFLKANFESRGAFRSKCLEAGSALRPTSSRSVRPWINIKQRKV